MKRYGLPKKDLLRKGGEFAQVYKQGKRLYGDNFILIYQGNGLGFNRLGISVHRQIKGAVKRNRIKRIIRESFRLNREQYPPSADIVVTVRPGFQLSSTAEMSRAVASLVRAVNQFDNN